MSTEGPRDNQTVPEALGEVEASVAQEDDNNVRFNALLLKLQFDSNVPLQVEKDVTEAEHLHSHDAIAPSQVLPMDQPALEKGSNETQPASSKTSQSQSNDSPLTIRETAIEKIKCSLKKWVMGLKRKPNVRYNFVFSKIHCF